jgi:hypothetical protein
MPATGAVPWGFRLEVVEDPGGTGEGRGQEGVVIGGAADR